MKRIFTALLGIGILASSCGGGKESDDIKVYDMDKAYRSEPFINVKVTDMAYVALDPDSAAMFSEMSEIKGVTGDTLIIMEPTDNYRILLFSLSDGRLLGTLNHLGQGPGEYRWIDNLYVDRAGHALVINTPDNVAYRYTTDDVLTDTYRYPGAGTHRLSKGSLEKGICRYQENDSGFIVRRLDRNFVQTDSVKVDGYKLGWLSGMFSTFGDECVLSMVDTVYAVRPGGLEKIMILSRGGRTITPEIEEEINNIMRSGGSIDKVMEKQAQYISVDNLLTDGQYISMMSFGDGQTSIDIFRVSDGTLVAHMPMTWDAYETSGLETEYKGAVMHLHPAYVDDEGRWYAIVSEGESVGADGTPNDGSLNVGVVSFRLDE